MSTTYAQGATMRNAELGDLAAMLQQEQVRKLDMVVPAKSLRAQDGGIWVSGAEPILTPDGVDVSDGWYNPTRVADEGIADKLGIPVGYLKRTREENLDLWDKNVQGWINQDDRQFMLRCLRGDDTDQGILRAFLSDRYSIIDNLDVLLAVLNGIKAAGVEVKIDGCDLSDRRMTVRVVCEEISALAPTLLKGYRSPFTGASGDDNPTVFAGFVFSNSETGGGAFSLTPRVVVQICNNGMTLSKDAIRAVHLGGRLDEGIINWSEETKALSVDLVTAKTKDAVSTFLDVDYVTAAIERLERKADQEVESVDKVREITKAAKFTQEQTDGILGHFIRGGQMTLGGVFNAATAFARTIEDPDDALAMEQAAPALLGI